MTLTEFLLARIAEDERAALEAGAVTYEPDLLDRHVSHVHSVHIARHSPSRVLVECEAKRRIVELHLGRLSTSKSDWYGRDEPTADMMGCDECGSFGEYTVAWPCSTLRVLAAVYSDHPDYDEEWRP